MYKKLVSVITLLYLSGCTVSKPVILNASYKQLNQVQKAYASTNTRNGTNQILLIDYFASTVQNQDRDEFRILFQLFATPMNNPAVFRYNVEENFGSYYNFKTTLPFNIKYSVRILKNNNPYITDQKAALLGYDAEELVFNCYHLPYDTDTRANVPDRSIIKAFTLNTTLNTFLYFDNRIGIGFSSMIKRIRDAQLLGNQIYLYSRSSENLTNGYQIFKQDMLAIDPLAYDTSAPDDMQLILNEFKAHFDLQTPGSTDLHDFINFDYDCSMQEELTAYQDGYSAGLAEGQAGTGTTWIQQVFRAIQSFLNIDFGFFKLAHVLGGMLVIAIVIFVVRWFR